MIISIIIPDVSWQYIFISSLIRGYKKIYKNISFVLYFPQEKYNFIYQDMLDVKIVNNLDLIFEYNSNIIINLSLDKYVCERINNMNNVFGFNSNNIDNVSFDKKVFDFYDHIVLNNYSKKNIYELLFEMCDLKWSGESPFIFYKSPAKVKHNTTGISIKDDDLRHFIKNNLCLNMTRKWHVPVRSNPKKFIDEISRCEMLITDNLFASMVSVAMKKQTYYLDYEHKNMNVIFFHKGKRHFINNMSKHEV